MLKIKDNVDLKELEKYGFKILVTDEQLEKNMEKEYSSYFCTRAYKDVGNHFTVVIENDEYENQITIVPDNDFPLKLCMGWQLNILYDLIKDGLVVKVDD